MSKSKSDLARTSYWKTVRAIAKKALYSFGTGPLYDFVHGTITRSPEHGEKVRAYVREQVEYSSWIVSDQHSSLVLQLTNSLGGNFDASLAMQGDVSLEAGLLLKAYSPAYYRLRFSDVRFVVWADFDDLGSNDYETPMQWSHPDAITTAIAKLENQYRQAKLPLPVLEIVAFNVKHQEIPSVISQSFGKP
jgi:hypothetical protein